MLTFPPCVTRATNGPGTECRTLKIRGSAVKKDRSYFVAPKIAGSKDEHSRFACSQSGDFQRTVSQPLILGENHPAALADCPKPCAVLLITHEVIVVDLDHKTGFDKLRSDWFYAQRPVDEKYSSVRR